MGAACGSQKTAPHEPQPAKWYVSPAKAAAETTGEVPVDTGRRTARMRAEPVRGVVEMRAKLTEVYDVHERLGEGAMGKVRRCTHRPTGAQRALKSVSKSTACRRCLRREMTAMASTNHPNVVKMFGVFEDSRSVHIVMELAGGGDLFDRIVEAHYFAEDLASSVMAQLLRAISHVHSCGIAHRDIKPENCVFERPGLVQGNTLKLIDFGLAKHCQPGGLLKSMLGTYTYMAPEVAAGRYDLSCDMWSAGAVLYTMLRGRPPITGETDAAILSSVRQGKWSFDGDIWLSITSTAKSLVSALLQVIPSTRLTAENALGHAWIEPTASVQ